MFMFLDRELLAHHLGPNRRFVPGAMALLAAGLSYVVGTYIDYLVFYSVLNVPTALIWIAHFLWLIVAAGLGQAAWWAIINRVGGAYIP